MTPPADDALVDVLVELLDRAIVELATIRRSLDEAAERDWQRVDEIALTCPAAAALRRGAA